MVIIICVGTECGDEINGEVAQEITGRPECVPSAFVNRMDVTGRFYIKVGNIRNPWWISVTRSPFRLEDGLLIRYVIV